jgi:glycosyltransferase involved in cell wall biosynthesis
MTQPVDEVLHSRATSRSRPRLIVYSSLFPSQVAPAAGTFIRERMFRVGKRLPIVVVAPQAWSPFDWIVRLFRKSFRPMAPERETMDGVEVNRPRWFSLPGVAKRFDGWLMWRGTERCVREIHQRFGATIVDAHFLYPDGWAATRIAKRLGLPCTITIRGSKDEWLIGTNREPFLAQAMRSATTLFAVSEALKRDVAVRLGIDANKVTVIGNGVDLEKFAPVDKAEARRRLGIAHDAKVIIGVGGLIPRKGFHRVIPLIPALRNRHPGLVYLIVGGGTTQADMRGQLEALAREHGVAENVRFCGAQQPEDLKWFYGAADAFVLATEHEGWANVFLEAMACGLPVITTGVGGNAQVVANATLGTVVDWWNAEAFRDAVDRALLQDWDRDAIINYAGSNTWDDRIDRLVVQFESIGAAPEPVAAAGVKKGSFA